MEFKGTKGNWEQQHRAIDEDDNYRIEVFVGETEICGMYWAGEKVGNTTYSRRKENAKLIAAAPDLLNALKVYLDAGSKDQRMEASIIAKKAIEKALK